MFYNFYSFFAVVYISGGTASVLLPISLGQKYKEQEHGLSHDTHPVPYTLSMLCKYSVTHQALTEDILHAEHGAPH